MENTNADWVEENRDSCKVMEQVGGEEEWEEIEKECRDRIA